MDTGVCLVDASSSKAAMKKGRWVVLMLVMGLVALAAAPSPAWAHWRGGVFIGVGSWWGPAYPYWWYPPPYYPYYYPPPTVIIEQPPVYVEQPTPPPAPPAPRTGTIARAARSTTRRSRRARRTGSRFHRDLNEGRPPDILTVRAHHRPAEATRTRRATKCSSWPGRLLRPRGGLLA